ncbi:glycosyltransferase family 8 protein [Actinobacillus delphinicola]|uniref:Glycosyl transferase family protein n=1 Tax=Actinobacillus delphinicola TaxID=51161 RepID=A0A448TU30_9PAST|nr:glycosyltransferase family 8 protein [Actinobacillus delphinicola]VEJ09489.1 glycosyl transferase family protein [Actinobacillus delphinicola]
MNILFNCDENYVPYLSVVALSIIKNHPEESVHFYVLSLNISQSSQKYLKAFCQKQGSEITFIEIDPQQFENLPKTISYISPVTYARLFAVDYLPIDLDRILYMDIDLIVNANLSSFYYIDFGANALAVVPDILFNIGNKEYKTTIGLSSKDVYFNAGVMLLNLEIWRTRNLKEDISDFITKFPNFTCQDQDILNYIFNDSKICVDARYNFQTDTRKCVTKWDKVKVFLGNTNCSMPIAIYHSTGHVKPWMPEAVSLGATIFSRYAKQVKDVLPVPSEWADKFKSVTCVIHYKRFMRKLRYRFKGVY